MPTHVAWCCDHELFAILDHPYAWIGWFFIVGAGTHAAIFLVLDYLERLLSHRHIILAHLNRGSWRSRQISSWTALLNQLQRVISPLECLQCCTAIGTQLLETSYGNGSGNLPSRGSEASLRCDLYSGADEEGIMYLNAPWLQLLAAV